jgi:hypothetical protein
MPFLAALLLTGLAVACGDTEGEDSGGESDAKVDAGDASEVPSDASEVPSDASEVPSDASEVPSDASEVPSDASEVPSDAQAECVVGSVVCEGDILVKCPNGERVETDCAAIGKSCHAQMGHCM